VFFLWRIKLLYANSCSQFNISLACLSEEDAADEFKDETTEYYEA
jgi:hypothetical protein